jgi:hypothetical protein
MTFIVLVLLFTLGFGILLAAELLRSRRDEEDAPYSDLGSRPLSFEPLGRLMDQRDIGLVKDNPDLTRKLASNRRRVVLAYLRELRHEFMRAFSICRLLAPVSPDPNFIATLTSACVSFHVAYFTLYVSCVTGMSINVERVSKLVQPLDEMRSRASALLDMDAALGAASSSR